MPTVPQQPGDRTGRDEARTTSKLPALGSRATGHGAAGTKLKHGSSGVVLAITAPTAAPPSYHTSPVVGTSVEPAHARSRGSPGRHSGVRDSALLDGRPILKLSSHSPCIPFPGHAKCLKPCMLVTAATATFLMCAPLLVIQAFQLISFCTLVIYTYIYHTILTVLVR